MRGLVFLFGKVDLTTDYLTQATRSMIDKVDESLLKIDGPGLQMIDLILSQLRNSENNTMSIYYGTVKGNTVILPREVRLAEGLTVQVRVWHLPRPTTTTKMASEAQFQQKLLELGLLSGLKVPSSSLKEATLISVAGKPLSELIIEERR